MTREEAIAELNTFKIGAKSELGENALDMAIKALEQEPCGDAISKASVFEILGNLMSIPYDLDRPINKADVSDSMNEIRALPPVTPIHRDRTVQDFIDKCRECGARYGRYKDFCEYVAKMVLRDDFEENAGANAEFLCRKLSKLGIVKADGENWVLAEMESEEW